MADKKPEAKPDAEQKATIEQLLEQIEVAVGQLSDRPASNAMLVGDIIQAVNGLRALLGVERTH